jgi:hypothetical protein
MEHQRLFLQRFKEDLKLRLKKCFFGLQQMEYMGYNVSATRTCVFTKKVEAVACRLEGGSQFCAILQLLRQIRPSF